MLVSLANQWVGPDRAYDFVARIGTLGIGPVYQDPQEKDRYRSFLQRIILESALQGQTPESFLRKIETLKDTSKDGVSISPSVKSTAGPSPVTLLIDAKALNPEDRNEIKSRLESLPEGSFVVEYVDQDVPDSKDILNPLMQEFPRLRYSRKSYRGQIQLEQIREVFAGRAVGAGMREHAVILFSSLEGFESSDLESLGVAAFQFDPAGVSDRYRTLRSLSAAVFGEIAEYAKLGHELNEKALQQGRTLGFFGFQNGVYSFLDAWFEARTTEELLAVAA